MPQRKGVYINHQWQQGNGEPFFSINPGTGERVWEGASASNTDIDEAVKSARKAFPGWSEKTFESRVQTLESFKQQLKESADPLVLAISQETGKPLWESKAEVESMINKVGISIEAHRLRCQEMVKELPHSTSVTRHRPHGVVVVFGPFNFPGHLPNGHIVPALLAGNTVVFKPSEHAPLVAELTIQCWEKAGLPPGVINLTQGGRDTGRYLAGHKGVDGLFFTGSWPTGRYLSEQFGTHPEKILALEMGGNNPLLVGDISDPKTAAYLTVQSAFLTSGQRCTCARRLIVVKGPQSESFIQELVRIIHGIKAGLYTEKPEPFMGPVISAQAALKLINAQEELIRQGGKPIVQMRLLKPGTGLLSPGLLDVEEIPERKDEEYFGPFLQMIRVPSFSEGLTEANRTAYGLAAGLLSENPKQYEQFYRSIRAGIVNWNTQLTGASSASPFGGIGRSGNHRPSAYYAADYCSYPVASLETPSMKMPASLSPGIALDNASASSKERTGAGSGQ